MTITYCCPVGDCPLTFKLLISHYILIRGSDPEEVVSIWLQVGNNESHWCRDVIAWALNA